ncbi:hypothetical protein T484DRAFT_1803185 [Baffinella frigidus]|nr:hypothetical protein T484DRAFT_1803185 [Cryptophyta sp. CCMP2293]
MGRASGRRRLPPPTTATGRPGGTAGDRFPLCRRPGGVTWPGALRDFFTAPAVSSEQQRATRAARAGYAASDPGEARGIEPFAPSAAEERPSAPFASPDAEERPGAPFASPDTDVRFGRAPAASAHPLVGLSTASPTPSPQGQAPVAADPLEPANSSSNGAGHSSVLTAAAMGCGQSKHAVHSPEEENTPAETTQLDAKAVAAELAAAGAPAAPATLVASPPLSDSGWAPAEKTALTPVVGAEAASPAAERS